MSSFPGSGSRVPAASAALDSRARPVRSRLLWAGCAFSLPALLLIGLMFVGSAEAEPASERQVPVSATLLDPSPGTPKAPEVGPAPSQNQKPEPPVAKAKPRKHRLLPVKDYGGY